RAPARRAGAEPRSRPCPRRCSRQRCRLLPRSLSAGVTDPRVLTVAEGLGEIAAGNMSGDEWFSAYADTPDELGAYLWRPQGDDRGPLPATAGDLAGVPVAGKDIFCIEGRPPTAGSRVPQGYGPPHPATAGGR